MDLAGEDRDLVPQGQDLQSKLVLGTEPGQRVAQERGDNCEHGSLVWGQIQQNQRLRSTTELLPPTILNWLSERHKKLFQDKPQLTQTQHKKERAITRSKARVRPRG